MLVMFARKWWVLALQGVLSLIFGLLVVALPLLTLQTLILLFGGYVLVNGVLSVIEGITAYGRERWWLSVVQGIMSIFIGIFTFANPGATALVLLFTIAAWAFVTGIFEIVAAIQLRRFIEGEWLMILSGIASIAFAVILFLFPGEGALALTWLIGVYAIAYGILLVIIGLRLRAFSREIENTTPVPRGF
jgi:uncharacterized membrane protein HdeD (DUF308 family)